MDISIDSVTWYQLEDRDLAQEIDLRDPMGMPTPFKILKTPDYYYWEFRDRINEEELKARLSDKEIYKIKFRNMGGLVMPLIVQLTLQSGKKDIYRIPAEIWRKNEYEVNKIFVVNEPVTKIILDPLEETADINTDNNVYPPTKTKSPIQKFKENNDK